MYHQSHVSGENEATFGIGRRPHHAFGIIAETKLLRRDAKSPAIQLPVSILILEREMAYVPAGSPWQGMESDVSFTSIRKAVKGFFMNASSEL